MKRKKFIKSVGLLSAAAYVAPKVLGNNNVIAESSISGEMLPAEFPALPFSYDSLEPYIDARTMEIHYGKHHRGYYNNLVNAVKGTALEKMKLTDIFAEISKQSDTVRNNSGGYYNHLLFWRNLSKNSGKPSDELTAAISKAFGSFDAFRDSFTLAAKKRFGSGWAWLYIDKSGKLAVGSTPNQDNPYMDVSPVKGIPLLALDVWEHAYYLKYQNRRPEYIDAFWNVVNWSEVNRRYNEAMM